MKKIITAVIISVVLLACKNDVPSAPAEPAPVDVTPPPSAVPEKPKPEMPQEKEGTSVQIGPDGVSVKNKDGAHKTDVKIKGDGKASVDVRSPK